MCVRERKKIDWYDLDLSKDGELWRDNQKIKGIEIWEKTGMVEAKEEVDVGY